MNEYTEFLSESLQLELAMHDLAVETLEGSLQSDCGLLAPLIAACTQVLAQEGHWAYAPVVRKAATAAYWEVFIMRRY